MQHSRRGTDGAGLLGFATVAVVLGLTLPSLAVTRFVDADAPGNCRGCGADFNCDLVVDGADVSALIGQWGACPGFCVPGPAGAGLLGDGGELEAVLSLLGFDGVAAFQAWLEEATPAEAIAVGLLLAQLLSG